MMPRRVVRLKQFVAGMFFMLVFPYVLSGQEAVGQSSLSLAPLNEGSVATQFNFVMEKSSKYEDSRVIKSFWLVRLKSHVLDTLKAKEKELADARRLIAAKEAEIDSLKTGIASAASSLSTISNERDSIRLFGILVNKSVYKSIVWSLIGGLAVLLLIFVVLFRRSNVVTVRVKADLEELKNEFETHRKRALEREAQMSRKHLDEINKMKK